MWALIGFIILGIVVATLIEVNERRKAKRQAKEPEPEAKEECNEACADCSLMDICEKKDA